MSVTFLYLEVTVGFIVNHSVFILLYVDCRRTVETICRNVANLTYYDSGRYL